MTGRDYQGINKGFLDAIPAHLSESLTLGADQIVYPSGGVIHGPGSRVRPGVLEAGLLRAYFTSRDGREATVTYIGPGEAVGLSTFFGAAPPVSLQALTDTRILHFEESRFAALLSTEVDIALAVAACFADRYVTGSQSVHGLVFGRVRARVAGHLLSLASREPDGTLVVNITQQGLANAVGSVRDVVARVLRDLRSEGVVWTSHGRVVVADENGLAREAAQI
ncbi:MAG TPA: Crp/Fnr family transcriptional regulator [Candidatus Solibacter sp.]|jgi:CRP/FNR family cyclic AMP-dependent transcriptional regulator|nr:Crp/Fnr family transcriptional regulator [Candidatus Solibacter sp.]